jgi:putative addiction module killer protein
MAQSGKTHGGAVLKGARCTASFVPPTKTCGRGPTPLRAAAAAKVSVALVRLGQGNTSNAKTVGEGVLEYRINWGPGYRVYIGRDGEVLVILLTGGTKQRQQRDNAQAKELWADYKRRRKPLSR